MTGILSVRSFNLPGPNTIYLL